MEQIALKGWFVPIAEIAKAAEVNEITVYRYFGDRDTLLLETLTAAARLNPMVPYLQTVLDAPVPAPLSEVMAQLTAIALGPAKGIYLLIFHAALNSERILLAWDGVTDRPHMLDLLTEYVSSLQSHLMISRAMAPDTIARHLQGILIGSFFRNAMIHNGENSDPDPIGTMKELSLLLSAIP
jgi:AcrR family transcriptional regulator